MSRRRPDAHLREEGLDDLLRGNYPTGGVWYLQIEAAEPIPAMIRHFAGCIIRDRQAPFANGEAGPRVVRILEAAQRSIKAQGDRITV